MKKTLIIPSAAILLGAAAFIAGRASVDSPSSPGVADAVARSSAKGSAQGITSDIAGSKRMRDVRVGSSRDASRKFGSTPEERRVKLEEIVKNGDAIERNRSLLAYIDQLQPGELPDAVAHFRSLGITNERFSEYAMLLTTWAKSDPAGALEYAKANTTGGFATGTILGTWTTNDPEAAIAWAESAHPQDTSNPYFAAIIGTLANSDPARATQLLTGMTFGKERGAALAEMLPHVLSQGADATRQWIAALGDQQLRDGAIQRAAGEMARTDPKGTADWLASLADDGAKQSISTVMRTWGQADSQAALGYFQSLPTGEIRSGALGGLISSLSGSDAASAASLIDRYPADANDDVVSGFVRGSSKSDPALAANYIVRIADPGQREDAYNRVLSRWMKRDGAAATAWIQTNPVPANVQRNLGLIQ